MKKVYALALAVCLAGFVAKAEDNGGKKHKGLTDDQKKLWKEMVEKYDTNKDGKLDKDEKAKMSADDKKKLEDAGIGGGHHKKKDK